MKYLVIISLFMASCGCNYHMNKVKSKCGFTTKVDTLTLHDTITTERTIKDTLFKHTKDTVVLKQNNLTVKYFYNTKDSTIYLQGKCDTVVKVVIKKIPINTTIYKPNFFNDNKIFLLLILLAVGGVIVIILKK